MNDSITKLDVDILNMESEEIQGSELGTIKYLSEVLGWDIKRTANLFILILIFVFDPLAITLVIATNQAFKGNKKDEDNSTVNTPDYPVNTPQVPLNYPTTTPQVEEETDQVPTNYRPTTDQVEPIIIEKIVEVPVEVIKEVEKIVEVPVYIEKSDVPVEEYFEREDLTELQEIKQEVEEKIKNNEEIINEVIQNEPKQLSYVNRNGGSFRINRI